MEPRGWWLGGAPSYWQLGIFHEDTPTLPKVFLRAYVVGVSRPVADHRARRRIHHCHCHQGFWPRCSSHSSWPVYPIFNLLLLFVSASFAFLVLACGLFTGISAFLRGSLFQHSPVGTCQESFVRGLIGGCLPELLLEVFETGGYISKTIQLGVLLGLLLLPIVPSFHTAIYLIRQAARARPLN